MSYYVMCIIKCIMYLIIYNRHDWNGFIQSSSQGGGSCDMTELARLIIIINIYFYDYLFIIIIKINYSLLINLQKTMPINKT